MEFDRDKLPASIDVAEKAIHQRLRRLPLVDNVVGGSVNINYDYCALPKPTLPSPRSRACRLIRPLCFNGQRSVIHAQGLVVWAQEGRQGLYFTEMSAEHQETVRAYISFG